MLIDEGLSARIGKGFSFMDELIKVCDQVGCKVSQDGKCIEGLPFTGPDKCPHFKLLNPTSLAQENAVIEELDEESDEDDINREDEAQLEHAEMHFLSSGEELTLEESSILMGESGARLIVIAGESESGKTTLLSCIYELFRSGPYTGYLFARSRTLRAFERVCHDSRVDSGRQTPDTERTPIGQGARFFHLAVRDENLSAPTQHLLISNISGEDFREARTYAPEASKMDFIRRADHFVLVLDGGRLANPQTRALARLQAQEVLRRFVELGMLGKSSQVDVLFSKWDCLQPLLEDSGETPESAASRLREFLDDTKRQFESSFDSRLGRLRFFEVSACPASSTRLAQGYGLEEVFKAWVEESAPSPPRTPKEMVKKKKHASSSASVRESARFVASKRSAPSKSVLPE